MTRVRLGFKPNLRVLQLTINHSSVCPNIRCNGKVIFLNCWKSGPVHSGALAFAHSAHPIATPLDSRILFWLCLGRVHISLSPYLCQLGLESPHSRSRRVLEQHFSRPFGWLLLTCSFQFQYAFQPRLPAQQLPSCCFSYCDLEP